MGAIMPAQLQMTLIFKFQSSKILLGAGGCCERNGSTRANLAGNNSQGTMEPPGPLSPFIFIDLREGPEAWAQIENELLEDARLTPQ
jgi:hypothetical protein